jgi:hypothetical protein
MFGGLAQCGMAALAKALAPKAMEFAAPGGTVRAGATISIEEKKDPFITITRTHKPGDPGHEQARQQLEAGVQKAQDEMPQRIASAWATRIGAAVVGGVLVVGIVRLRRAER